MPRRAIPREAAFARIATAIGKYWICKRAPAFVNEAQECLGGAGYVEESILPRLYRQAPLNSIWEGSGNIQCLDVLRALAKEPETGAALWNELRSTAGDDADHAGAIERLRAPLAGTRARRGSRRADACRGPGAGLQAAVLLRAAVRSREAFCRSRLGGAHGLAFGTLPPASVLGRSDRSGACAPSAAAGARVPGQSRNCSFASSEYRPPCGHQRIVRALGDDAATVHDHDAVGLEHGGEAMRDHQRGAARHQVFQRVLHGALALGVERGGGFVEQQDRGILQQGAGDGDALLLAAGQARAAFAEFAGEALGQGVEEVVGFGGFGGGAQLGVGRVEAAVADVVGGAGGEDRRRLRHQRDRVAQVRRVERAQVDAVDRDRARLRDRGSAAAA